jgi:NAD(P)-dependent dehydrogenase (short-subunit alcohol dehydrogenase family)
MQNSLMSKVSLVTGASRGIGAAVARLLAQRGADVAAEDASRPSGHVSFVGPTE